MTDGGNTNGLLTIGQLIKGPVSTDTQRIDAVQFAAQSVPGSRLALQQPQGSLDRIDQRPVKLQQLVTSSPGEDESRQ